MNRYYIIMLVSVFLLLTACGSNKSDQIEKFPKPQSQQEFQQLLDKLGISLYEGSEIHGFHSGNVSSLYTMVPRVSGSPEEIADYYKKELDKALSPVDNWKVKVSTTLYVLFMNDETKHQFAVSVSNKSSRGGYSTILKIDKSPGKGTPDAGEVPVYEKKVEKPY